MPIFALSIAGTFWFLRESQLSRYVIVIRNLTHCAAVSLAQNFRLNPVVSGEYKD